MNDTFKTVLIFVGISFLTAVFIHMDDIEREITQSPTPVERMTLGDLLEIRYEAVSRLPVAGQADLRTVDTLVLFRLQAEILSELELRKQSEKK